ncbi:MAG: N(4)-(beta-N-acetylglucosaminyl)-L-asparaginase [candidate division WOR-3 bacterium]|nr:N(4)-(beta-N-acetylglucosaminyl)-L-asparaginase [candidate division WOR-3 bacterium]
MSNRPAMTILANCEGRVGMDAARQALLAGRPGLDVAEAGIREVESDVNVKSVGRGGGPNLLGEVVCDAAIMDGRTLKAGSVGSLRQFLHAVSVARQVMERLPHVMLVGDGAHRFAGEIGAEKAEMLTDEQRQKHEQWLREHVPADVLAGWPNVPLAEWTWVSGKDYASGGTTTFLIRDAEGNITAGTSTSGWARSYPGRLGDSPIIGAGLYADNRYGACACTHTGEMTIRAGTSRAVVSYMKAGASVREACLEAMRDLASLEGGQLGPVVIHAIDRGGEPCVLTTHELGFPSSYFLWREGAQDVAHEQAEVARSLPPQGGTGDMR